MYIPSNNQELLKMILQGISRRDALEFIEEVHILLSDIAIFLPLSIRTFQRYSNDKHLNTYKSERFLRKIQLTLTNTITGIGLILDVRYAMTDSLADACDNKSEFI